MDKILEKIKTLDFRIYPKIWSLLNKWQFPEDLCDVKPHHWDILDLYSKHQLINSTQRYIESIIPKKELLRYWNKDRLNDIEFEIWWNNRISLEENTVARKILNTFNYQLNTNFN